MNFHEFFTNLINRAHLAEDRITIAALRGAMDLYIVEQQAHVAQVATLANKLTSAKAERDAALAALAERMESAADSIIDAILANPTGQRAATEDAQ